MILLSWERPPPRLNQAFDSDRSSGSSIWNNPITRRSFLKRGGAVTVSVLVALQTDLKGETDDAGYIIPDSGDIPGYDISCSALRLWSGEKVKDLDFAVCAPSLQDDINALRTEFGALADALFNSIDEWLSDNDQPWLDDILENLTGQDKIDAIRELLEQIFDEVVLIGLEALIAETLIVHEAISFYGSAYQAITILSSPAVRGPGSLLDVSIAGTYTFSGIGIGMTLRKKLSVDLADLPECGFHVPDGPTTIKVPCEGGKTRVGEGILLKCEFSGSITFMGISIDYLIDGEGSGGIIIVPIKSELK